MSAKGRSVHLLARLLLGDRRLGDLADREVGREQRVEVELLATASRR